MRSLALSREPKSVCLWVLLSELVRSLLRGVEVRCRDVDDPLREDPRDDEYEGVRVEIPRFDDLA